LKADILITPPNDRFRRCMRPRQADGGVLHVNRPALAAWTNYGIAIAEQANEAKQAARWTAVLGAPGERIPICARGWRSGLAASPATPK
jgi:hypothetical protein